MTVERRNSLLTGSYFHQTQGAAAICFEWLGSERTGQRHNYKTTMQQKKKSGSSYFSHHRVGAEYSCNKQTVHHRQMRQTTKHGQFSHLYLVCMFLDSGGKQEHLQKTQPTPGEHVKALGSLEKSILHWSSDSSNCWGFDIYCCCVLCFFLYEELGSRKFWHLWKWSLRLCHPQFYLEMCHLVGIIKFSCGQLFLVLAAIVIKL